MEFIWRSYKMLAGYFRDSLGDLPVKAGRSVQPCTYGRSSESQLMKLRKRQLKKLSVAFERTPPSADFLRKFNWSSVLQMCASAFYNVSVFSFKALKRTYQQVKSRKKLILNCQNCRYMHCRRKCVIRGLTHVYIVIRMQKLLSCNFVSAVGNNLICVHV